MIDVFLLSMDCWAVLVCGVELIGHSAEEDEVCLDIGYEM